MTKSKKGQAVQDRLQRAMDALEPVRITRGIWGADVFCGYVLSIGRKWTLLASISSDYDLDGHVAIRSRDIVRVQRHQQGDFPSRLLKSRGQWPPRALDPAPPLERTGALLQALARHGPLVSLHIENDDPDVLFIGLPVEWTHRALWMQEIDPEGIWVDTVSKWRFRDITAVAIGARYEAALFEMAEPLPRQLGTARQ